VTPADEYTRRLRARETVATRHEKAHARLGGLRLTTFGLGAVAAWLSLQIGAFSAWWLLVPLGVFVALVVHHARVRGALGRVRRTAAFYREGLERLEDRWAGKGRSGERFDDTHHVYSADLDLFGEGSVFELLCAARTRMGENALAAWLLQPAEPPEIRDRQSAARELRDSLDLRETWAILGEEAGVGVHPERFREWAQAPSALTQRWIPWVAWSVPALVAAGAVLWTASGIASPFLAALLVAVIVRRLLQGALLDILRHTENDSSDLKLLMALTATLEVQPFAAARLRDHVQRLSSQRLRASRALASLTTIVQLVESRRNPIVAVLDIPLMYSVHVALAAERWRARHGRQVRAWLEVIADFEAIFSIAAYSYEHPEDPYPELIEGAASFEARELGHPLMPRERCVTNDVTIEGETRVLLVSGSNMSGKSTLLRAVGVNTVLAMAGAPVRARSLRLTPLQVGASIRINDSLREGSSRFYAEITRLRQLLELCGGPRPLLFLLDELLQGTNSRDRRIGAEGIVRSFVDRGAIGLLTTHDLSLTEMADESGKRLCNLHFEDELEGGRMTFDYKLRDGVVTKSNGIALMRSIGLEV
jgi:hypothetical protein